MNRVYGCLLIISATLCSNIFSVQPARAEKAIESVRNGDFCIFSYEKDRINLVIYNLVRVNENFVGPRRQAATITPMSDELNKQVSGPTGQWGAITRAGFVKGTMVQLRFRNVKPGLRVIINDDRAYATGQCMTTSPKIPGIGLTRRVINYDF